MRANRAKFAKTRLRLCFVPDVPDRSLDDVSINWANAINLLSILNGLELRRKRSRILSGALPRRGEEVEIAAPCGINSNGKRC